MQVTTEAHTKPLRASPMPDIPKPASCPDKAGDPPSSPPQVEVQAAMGTHTEPLEAPATIDMHELVNASSTIVKHKQSLASAHEAADRPSHPSQVKGLDTACNATGAHTEPPRASQQSRSLMRPPSILIILLIKLSRPQGLILQLQFSRPESPPFV